MPCKTCDATVQNLGLAGAGRCFWCPNCGTLMFDAGGGPADILDVPAVTRRLVDGREFAAWEDEFHARRRRLEEAAARAAPIPPEELL